jgi:hypothetical protein
MKNPFQPPVQLCLNRIGGKEISTVLLPRFENEVKVWETCVFYDIGNSDVVARYVTEADAIQGHNTLILQELKDPSG